MWYCRVYSTCWYPHSPWFNHTVWEGTAKSLLWARIKTKLAAWWADGFVVPHDADGNFGVNWEIVA